MISLALRTSERACSNSLLSPRLSRVMRRAVPISMVRFAFPSESWNTGQRH